MNSSLHCRGQHRGAPSPVSKFRLSNLLPLVWRRLSIQFYLLEMHFSLLQIHFSVTLTSHMRIRSLKNKPTEPFQLCRYSLLLGSQVFQMETTSLAFAAFTRRMCSLLKRYSACIRSNSLSAYSSAYIRMQLLEACCSALSWEQANCWDCFPSPSSRLGYVSPLFILYSSLSLPLGTSVSPPFPTISE